ncbi:MAG: ABC transporter permease [Actinomycetes bacterium]
MSATASGQSTSAERRSDATAGIPGARRSPDEASRGAGVASLTQLRILSQAMLRGFFRDRTALFFTFFFPLMFLIVFGLLFRSGGDSRTTIGVVGSGPVISALPQDAVTVKKFDSLDAALAKVRAGDVPAVIVEQGDTVVLRYSAADQVKAATVRGLVSAVVDAANVAATGQPPRFALTAQQVESNDLKPIQYLTPGILSWGIATSAAFGAALTLVTWRRKQLLRRVRLSPAPVATVLGARVAVALVVALVQALVFTGVALTPPFGLRLTGSWYLALPLLVAGTLAFLSIGLLVGSIAKTDEAASAMVNFVVLPMAFLSGTFFDISQAPPWMQTVSKIFPLRHMNDGMLDVLVRGKGISALLVPMAFLLGFTAVMVLISRRFFTWDDA